MQGFYEGWLEVWSGCGKQFCLTGNRGNGNIKQELVSWNMDEKGEDDGKRAIVSTSRNDVKAQISGVFHIGRRGGVSPPTWDGAGKRRGAETAPLRLTFL